MNKQPYNKDCNIKALVGYLSRQDGKFYCDKCIDKHNPDNDQINVYLINILPYSQTCFDCNTLIVDGIKTVKWGFSVPLSLFE
jgi:hypothetical protein